MTSQNKKCAAQRIIDNRTTGTLFEFKTHGAEVGHSVVIAPTKVGMSVYDALRLSDAELAAVRTSGDGPVGHGRTTCEKKLRTG